MSEHVPAIKPEWLEGITMNSEQKGKWLAALRGRKYRQSRQSLSEVDRDTGQLIGNCCLGVYAMEVHKKTALEMNGVSDLGAVYIRDLGEWGSYDNKFSSIDPKTHITIQRVLAAMNDSGKTFSEIADFIEQHIPACDEAKP